MDPNPENVRQDAGAADGDASGGDGVVGSLLPEAYPPPSSMTAIMWREPGEEGGRGTEYKSLGNQLGSSCGRRHSVHISYPSTASLSVAPSQEVEDTAIARAADGCKQPGRGKDIDIKTMVATKSSPLPILERCRASKGKNANVSGCVCTPRENDVAFRETDAAREGRACTDTTGRTILRSRVTAKTEDLAMRGEDSNGHAILKSSRLTNSGLTRFPRGGIGPPSTVGPNRKIISRMVILGSSTDSPQGDRESDMTLVRTQAGYSRRVDEMAWGDCVVDSTKRPRRGALEVPTRDRNGRDSSLERMRNGSGSDYEDENEDEDDSCPTLPTSLASPWRGDSGGGSYSSDSSGGGPSRTWSSFDEAVPPWGSGCKAGKMLVRVHALCSMSAFNHTTTTTTTTTFREPRDTNMQCQGVEATAHLMGCLSIGAGSITIRRRDKGSIDNTAAGLETKSTLQQQQQRKLPRLDEGRNASS